MNRNEKELFFRTNHQIKSELVRLVGDNIKSDIYSLSDALLIADRMNTDLIEINSKVDPPICKVEDYDKFLYQQKKKQKEIEKNNKMSQVETKEIRFTPNIDEHDLNFKKNHIINFLKNGDKVRIFVFFKGREINYKEKGEILLLKLADELSDIAVVEKLPRFENNKLLMLLKPKK